MSDILSNPVALATIIGAIIVGLFGLLGVLFGLLRSEGPDATSRQRRQEAYAELYALTERASPAKEPLSYDERMALRSDLEIWYFQKGGPYLSKRSKELLDEAKNSLAQRGDDPEVDDPEVSSKAVSAVSRLRGQIRKDLGVRAWPRRIH